jgi:hypothetical protein
MSLSRVSPTAIVAGQTARVNAALRYVVTVACAASAGVHAALVRPHLEEAVPLGLAFAASALALALVALAVRQPRHDPWAPAAATAVLCLIAVGYLLSRTAGIPLLITQPEGLDPLGAMTTAAELAGAAAGALLLTTGALPQTRKDSE